MKKLLPVLFLLLLAGTIRAQFTNAVVDTLTNNSIREEVNNRCFAIDDNNVLHVIFLRENPTMGWDIYYRNRDVNGNWSAESLINDQPGYNPSLSVNRFTGLPAVVYESSDPVTQIMLATYSGTAWTNVPLTSTSAPNYSPDISVDSAGFYHVAYIGEDSTASSQTFKIFYTTNVGGNWATDQLTASQLGPFGTGAAPVIAVDNMGAVHIAFRSGNFQSYKITHAFNIAPGSIVWGYDQISTPNAEDFIAAIEVGNDTAVHLLVTGNDGFGFPSRSYYLKKNYSASTFDQAIAVAPGFSASVGGIFVDPNNVPHFILDEISGNIFTGNVIYADSTDWSGQLLLQTNDTYYSSLVMDSAGNGYVLAILGNTFQTQEVIVYGYKPFSSSVTDPRSESGFNAFVQNQSLQLIFHSNYNGPINVLSTDGRLVYNNTVNTTAKEVLSIPAANWSSGTYVIRAGNSTRRVIIQR